MGIDLAAKNKNPTGICVLNSKLSCFTVFKDEEILDLINKYKPLIVAIDAPLNIEIPFREAERELIKRGFHVLPLSLKSMQELSLRAQKLISKIKSKVIETFPRAVERILRFNYKLFKLYFRNKHEYDAWLCAIVAKLYYYGFYENLKGIILPKIK